MPIKWDKLCKNTLCNWRQLKSTEVLTNLFKKIKFTLVQILSGNVSPHDSTSVAFAINIFAFEITTWHKDQ